MAPDNRTVDAIVARVELQMACSPGGPLVVGLCGAQGSGKSTVAATLRCRFEEEGIATAVLSIDDIYRTRAEREALAREIHPLLRTRGVPGTHDVALGLSILNAIRSGKATPLPRFDKAIDDRAPASSWDVASPATRLVILEGWCVGARPEPVSALAAALNDLERFEDPDGRWRRYVNAALAGEYALLFARLDLLVLLAAPAFDTVFGWRVHQEQALRARTGRGMTDEEVTRFVRHYERVTRHILAEMPSRADLLVQLDAQRRSVSAKYLNLPVH